MELLVASGADIDARDENQGTLLMHFARQGKAEPVQWLLAHGADRDARNKSGKTAAEIGRAARRDRKAARQVRGGRVTHTVTFLRCGPARSM